MTCMVLLVGEQPIPNLLPVLAEAPQAVVLVHTDRTAGQAKRLAGLLAQRCRIELLSVPAYDILQIRNDLGAKLAELDLRGPQAVFNLTGGTKTMAFAAYELAVRLGTEFLYLQSEKGRSLVYRYVTAGGAPILRSPTPVELPALLSIDDYLRAHVSDYRIEGPSTSEGGLFEKALYEALRPDVDEIAAGVRLSATVEIDLIIRCGNQVGIAEAKTSRPKKEAIGQLTTAGGREYLGTYTRKFLMVGRSWQEQEDLRDLATAREIELIQLPSFQDTGHLSQDDRQKLCLQVRRALGCVEAKPNL